MGVSPVLLKSHSKGGSTMFERASRMKYRFDTTKGMVSVEDLWDLPLTSGVDRPNLDDVARGLHKQLKTGDDVSFVIKEKKSDDTTQCKFDIVKHIIDVRIAENEAALKLKDIKDKKQQILGIIAQKENESLSQASIDDLKKMLESM